MAGSKAGHWAEKKVALKAEKMAAEMAVRSVDLRAANWEMETAGLMADC